MKNYLSASFLHHPDAMLPSGARPVSVFWNISLDRIVQTVHDIFVEATEVKINLKFVAKFQRLERLD